MTDAPAPSERPRQGMPPWLWRAIGLFWLGFIATLVLRWGFDRLHNIVVLLVVSLFLSFAIEPGVNRLARRGWRRGSATGLILFGVFIAALAFVVSIGTLMFRQVADLLQNSDQYIDRTVEFLNDNFGTNIDAAEVKEQWKDPDGPVQEFIKSHSDDAVRLSAAALGFLLQMFSVMLITFYLVADGPRMRRAMCSRLRPSLQRRVLEAWDLAITKTGGYLYSRVLLAGLSAFFHWIAFQIIGVPAPVALALWVGVISQFIPVVGTYIAGVLPVLITAINDDSLVPALVVLVVIVVYQQIENYVFAPRITARTLELHPAIAFTAALAGAATLGAVGAVLALPATAMVSAFLSEWGKRHEVEEHPLTEQIDRSEVKRRRSHRQDGADEPSPIDDVAGDGG